jgi:hypothetical protein
LCFFGLFIGLLKMGELFSEIGHCPMVGICHWVRKKYRGLNGIFFDEMVNIRFK